MGSPKIINVSVPIGYDYRTVQLSELEWKRVQQGKELIKEVEDSYEGYDYIYTFDFNSNRQKGSSLVVTHEPVEDEGHPSGATGFIGNIEDAEIDIETDS